MSSAARLRLLWTTMSEVMRATGRSILSTPLRRRRADIPHLIVQQDQHHLYASSGARCPLLARAVPYETSSATLTQLDSSAAGVDLDRYGGCLRCTRALAIAPDAYRLDAHAYVDDLDVQIRVYDVSTDTDLGTLSCDGRSSSGAELVTDTLDLSTAEATSGGEPRLLLLSIVGARFSTKDGGTSGLLYALTVIEQIASGADLP